MKSCDNSPTANGSHGLRKARATAAASWSAVAATLLWNIKRCASVACSFGDNLYRSTESGVALHLPPHSKTWRHFGWSLKNVFARGHRAILGLGILLLIPAGNILHANPTGGTVTQGSATFNTSGSQFNINQASANALINWQSFNIGVGETVNFNQPTATSVAWNQINDSNPSQILGSLNANGYVILQNSSGFVVGGQAAITAHGLIMTTAATPTLNLSSGGPWSFNAPPPIAKIVNYGQINITGGGQAYLIANDIENNGTISAPGGKIGLYAGQTVLVSTSPDGRGLSAQATIPQGLVDNNGNLIADAGGIALQAQMVNQNGLIQANSAQNVNGTIELVGSDSVNLGANSVISAHGDSQGASSGGSVTIKSDNSFSDQDGSTINIAGGAQGGNGGQVEISAPQMSAINSIIHGWTMDGFMGGTLTIDPANIWLASSDSDPNAPSGYSVINVSSFIGLSHINLQADNNIELATGWGLADSSDTTAALSLSAGNNITLDGSISAGKYWGISLTAGTAYSGTTRPDSGYGIYLNGAAYIQAQDGNVNLWAANEVIVGSGAIRTIGGGNIDVTAKYGNVNSGTSANGFNYLSDAPYYTPFVIDDSGSIDYTQCQLGGISTAAGGNVTINAGGDVISFPAEQVVSTTSMWPDPGTGAFGSEPGNVTITAGGSVYGHFVEVNGTGTINAGQNIGMAPSPNNPNVVERDVALSLVKGSWNLNAGWDPVTQSVQSGVGDIFLQEVRNPNGVFNDSTTISGRKTVPAAGNHLFDYDPQASVSLTAGDGVYLTGHQLPRPSYGGSAPPVPMLLPPILTINAGPGGVTLQAPTATDGQNNVSLLDLDITLFPSPYQNLEISTTDGGSLNGNGATLLMSDSGYMQWFVSNSGIQPFGENDHASIPALLNNIEPATIDLAGSMENLTLQTDKATDIYIAGDMINCSFYGENLQATGPDPNAPAPGSVTSITVVGQIYNAGSFNSVILDEGLPTLPAADLPPTAPPGTSLTSWYLALVLAVDPTKLPTQSLSDINPSQLGSYLVGTHLFPGLSISGSLAYDPNTKALTAIGPLSSALFNTLESGTLTVLRYGPNGYPLLDANGHFVTDTINWVPSGTANASLISSLYASSQSSSPLPSGAPPGYIVGGTGQFNVTAGSISLGNSAGILSVGVGSTPTSGFLGGHADYSFLAPYITSGATIKVTVLDPQQTVNGLTEPSLYMPASAIASLGGGDVSVSAPDGSMDLGSQELLNFESQIMDVSKNGLGIYAAASGNVTVTALGTINIDSSRIATFDGGDIFIESYTGDVNAGNGGTVAIPINYFTPSYSDFPLEFIPASGIVAGTLTAAHPIPPGAATLPGNITIITPQGSILANAGGISQVAYDETLSAASGYTAITLMAGTPAGGDWSSGEPPVYAGDIILGSSGVIGVNVIANATGTITGRIFSQGNASVTGETIGNLLVVAGGKADVSAQNGSTGPITIVAIGGVNANGIGSATLFTTSVNGGAGTLATSSSASSASQSAAGQTSAENQQQVASKDSGNDDDKDKKKKAALARSVGRVTVILPKTI